MSREAEAMRAQWDRFAREDPMYFINAARADWTEEEFLRSGREGAAALLEFAGDGIGSGSVLEIGCGLGRYSAALAERFERVEAVDVSPEMIARAGELVRAPNVRFGVVSGSDLAGFADGSFDLVVSFLVFQHISSEAAIASYLREAARVLRSPGGRAVVQFDTRPAGMLTRLYARVPDPLLPRRMRRFMRRYRRDPERVRELAAAAGLAIERERGSGGPVHLLLLRVADGARPPAAGSG